MTASIQQKRLTEAKIFRAVIIVTLTLMLLPEAARARIPIEEAQREFQARYFVLSSNYVVWPSPPCAPAPHFPPGNFYGDLDKNPALAVQLVQDLSAKFYGGIYADFFNTPDGSGNIEGVTNYIEAGFNGNYTSANFPTSGSGFDLSNITTNNYAACLAQLKQYIEMLNYLPVSMDIMPADEIFADTVYDLKVGNGTSTNSCEEAKSLALSAWSSCPLQTTYPFWWGPGFITTSSDSSTATNAGVVTTTYNAGIVSWNGRLRWSNSIPGLIQGTLSVYVRAYTNSLNGAGPNPPLVAGDGAYHIYQTDNCSPGSVYWSSPFVSSPSIGGDCPDFTSEWNDGWALDLSLVDGDSQFGVILPVYKTDPDTAEACDSSCGSGNCQNTPGFTSAQTDSLNVKISLGPDANGLSAGYLYIHADQPSAALYSPASLSYSISTSGDVTPSFGGDGSLTEVDTPNAIATVQTNGLGTGYTVTFKDLSADFISSVTIAENGDTNHMTITSSIIDTNTPKVIQFSYVNTSSTNWNWTMSEGSGLRIESRTTAWTSSTVKTDTIVVSNASGAVASQTAETYQLFPWGSTLVQKTEGTGSAAKTTTWTYYASTDGTNNYGQIKQLVEPSGRWEQYQYDFAGRLTNKVSQFGDNTAPGTACSTASANRATQITYDDANGIITTVDQLLGTEISRTYETYWVDTINNNIETIQTIRCTVSGASISNAFNLTNIVWRTTDTSVTGQAWDTLKELHEDGTMSFYSYSVSGGQKTTAVSTGTPNTDTPPDGILDGTQTIMVVGMMGEIISNIVVNISPDGSENGLVIDADSYNYGSDITKRSYTVLHLDATTETFDYSCCGLDSQTDRDGVTTSYVYDAAKRLLGTIRLSITTTNLLDAAGRVLETIRVGTDGTSSMQLWAGSYDNAGFLVSETNALNGVTTHSWGTNSSTGEIVFTNTFADGGTSITTNYQDGSVLAISGTAARPVRYIYGVDGSGVFTATVKLTTGGGTNEWVKDYIDFAGRPYKTAFADGASSMSFYNNIGQLSRQGDPDGVTNWLYYNAKGEQTTNVMDVNQNGSIDWSGPDRITFITNDVVTDNSITVQRSRTYVWSVNSNTSILASTTESSADRLIKWSIIWNNGVGMTNCSQTVYAGSGNRYITNSMPDGSCIISAYLNGRLISATHNDANGSQIGKTTYSYDIYGRQTSMNDARNGTTTLSLNNAGQTTSITTPLPGNGQSAQTTVSFYDTMGRVAGTLQSDGATVTNLYYPTSLMKQTHGSRTYPVGYGYDAQGRMTTMTNWTSFAGNTGARVTTWNYDSERGWLNSKQYDDGHGPSYTYTSAGRLASRLWVRGTTTSYTYDGAGGLSTTTYNDGVTPGITNGYDRLGRLTTISNGPTFCTLTYNDAGKLLSESYAGGALDAYSITNGYDVLLRRTNNAVLHSGTVLAVTTNNFDAASRLLFVSDRTNSATYSYIANSPLVDHITFAQSGTTRMTTTNQYDYRNRLLSKHSGAGLSYAYQYNQANQRTEAILSDNSHWNYGYDSLGQVTSGKKFWSDWTPVAGEQFEYAFDEVGNRTSTKAGGDSTGAEGSLRSAGYLVNDLNQYTNRTVPNAVDILGLAYATSTATVNGNSVYRKGEFYDYALGVANSSASVWQSVTNQAVSGSTTNTVVGNEFVPQNSESYTYDADGNLSSDGRWNYTWDAENRLVDMTSLANALTNTAKFKLDFTYDYMGRRIQKLVSTNNGSVYLASRTNLFAYDGWNLAGEINGANNTLIRSYMWGNDLSGTQQGSGGAGGLLKVTYVSASTTNCFVAFDGNGNVAGLVNATDGTTLAQYEYGPFGELLRTTGPFVRFNPYRFSTEYQDDESDLVYYGYRYYSPSTGRWLSRDPIQEHGGLNLYSIVKNDPVEQTDSFGLYDAYYAGYRRARFSQHGGLMLFVGRCPICERVDPDSVKINLADIAQAIIADLEASIAADKSALAQENGPPNPGTWNYENQIAIYQQAINNIQSNPTHISGLAGIKDDNIQGDPFTLDIYMNSRFSLGFPGTMDPRYVKDEVNVYIAVTKVTYNCILACTLHPLPPSNGPGY